MDVPNKVKLTEARAISGRVRIKGLSACFWMIVTELAMLIGSGYSEPGIVSRE